ncbi:MAG: hypothetical protein R2856_15645 [Caldilineaceae bacterium]
MTNAAEMALGGIDVGRYQLWPWLSPPRTTLYRCPSSSIWRDDMGKGMMGWLMRDGKKMPYHLGHHQRRSLHRRSCRGHGRHPAADGRAQRRRSQRHHRRAHRRPRRGSGALRHHPGTAIRRQKWPTSSSPTTLVRPAEFYADLAQFVAMMRASRTRPDVDEILLPGELEWRRMQEKKAAGVPADPVIYAETGAKKPRGGGVAGTLEE